jgi:hypothetical protein
MAVLVALVSLIGLTAGAATLERAGLTWDELKLVQATERTEMATAQSEQLGKLVEVQEKEVVAMSGLYPSTSALNMENLAKTHADERKEIAKTFAEERVAVAKTHADERKAFLAGQEGQKPPEGDKPKQ